MSELLNQLSESATSIMNNLSKIMQQMANSPTIEHVAISSLHFANYMETLAHLLESNKLDKELGNFFKFYFHDAYKSIHFMNDKMKEHHPSEPPTEDLDEKLQHLKNWCESNKLEKEDRSSAQAVYRGLIRDFA